MAKAEAVIKQVEKVTYTDVQTVSLELSTEEAEAVIALLGRCAVHGITHGIYTALRDAGVNRNEFEVDSSSYAIIVKKV
jgi:hypothetical protein